MSLFLKSTFVPVSMKSGLEDRNNLTGVCYHDDAQVVSQ